MCLLLLAALSVNAAHAFESIDDTMAASSEDVHRDDTTTKESPWMLVPVASSDPKVGTSGGLMAGYLFKLDPDSTSSMVGTGATYSTTDSVLGGIFLRSFWDSDSKRLTAAVGGGRIRNDYEDFLGSGLPVQTTDTLKLYHVRYLQELGKGWFGGIQGVYTNYLISSEDALTQEILKILGLTGVDSAGVGLVAMYDDRDSQNSPHSGRRLQLNNFAFRKSLAGDADFDTYNLEFSHYLPHGKNNVFAYRIAGRWTNDAAAGAYSSVTLRGYVRGQYLAPHSSMVEVEERWHIRGRYGMNVFAGAACLYGAGRSCADSENLFSSVGLGGQAVINEAENMTMTCDCAFGERGNYGFYMRFGQAF